MSASLVGSEMCIRDRRKAAGRGGRGPLEWTACRQIDSVVVIRDQLWSGTPYCGRDGSRQGMGPLKKGFIRALAQPPANVCCTRGESALASGLALRYHN
eukprot:5753921-Alexandrium_andersonii.AAC.1